MPDVDQVVLAIVPLLPFPDASVTVVPDPSSNPYAATKPRDAASTTFDEAPTSVTWNSALEQLLAKNLTTAALPFLVKCPRSRSGGSRAEPLPV